jgi:hypothetical protein
MITRNHSLKPIVTLTALVAALTILGGCLELQGSGVRTGPYVTPKSPGAHIDVYESTLPAMSYIEVGLVSAKGSGYSANMSDVLYVLEDEARLLGADAVIVTDSWYTTTEYYDAYYDEYYEDETLHMTGSAIIYVD